MMLVALSLMILNGSASLSSRCVAIADPGERVQPALKIAPGAPPILSFRLYEGQAHHRYGNMELMLDDAGH